MQYCIVTCFPPHMEQNILAKGAFADTRDYYNYTPLIHASIHGHPAVAEVSFQYDRKVK